MKKSISIARIAALVLGVTVAATACQKPRDAEGNPVASIPRDSTAYFRERLVAANAVSAEKDSLIRDLSETTRLIADVSTEIATISSPGKSVTPVVSGGTDVAGPANARAEVLAKVKDLTARVKRSESRLAATQRRLNALTGESDSLKVVLSSYTSTIGDLQQVVEGQKASLEQLNEELNLVKTQNAQLAEANATLTDTVSNITTRENTVYYVIGTKKELKEKGIIVEEGGTRFLLFTRTGETLRPARELDSTLFVRADRRELKEISMPKPDQEYKVVSRQNLAFATAPELEKNKFRGALQITDPSGFWGLSKYLIIVED